MAGAATDAGDETTGDVAADEQAAEAAEATGEQATTGVETTTGEEAGAVRQESTTPAEETTPGEATVCYVGHGKTTSTLIDHHHYHFMRVKFQHFPLTLLVVLTTLSHYRVSV